MDDRIKKLLSGERSVLASNKNAQMDINIESKTRPVSENNLSERISQNTQFELERSESNIYRFYGNIKSIVSNVLFNDNLKIYFGNKTEYVKSLNTNNINNARLIAKYLISKFNYIKRSFNMFSAKEIKHYIDEFKKTNPNIQQLNVNFDALSTTAVALQTRYILDNANPIGSKQQLSTSGIGDSYDNVHSRYHDYFTNLTEYYEFYDLFIVDNRTGNIIYSVYKELDFATSLLDGPYANSNIARVFKKSQSIKTGNDSGLRDLNTKAFVTRLRWLSEKFKDIERSSVGYQEPANLSQSSIDDLMNSLGL